MSGTTLSGEPSVGAHQIAAMVRDDLIASWQRMFDRDPPARLATVMMRKILAYEVQCRESGGLAGSDRRALASIAAGRKVSDAVPRSVAEGSGLVREWNGRLYRVQVVADGYEMDGVTYRSLSAIARKITGAAWSGPRFFGLTSKRAS